MSRKSLQSDTPLAFYPSTKFAGVMVVCLGSIAVGFIAYAIQTALNGPSMPGDAENMVYAGVADDLFGDTDGASSPAGNPWSVEKRFATLIEPIKLARDKRLAIVEATKQSIDSSLYEVSSSVNASDFADNVLGFDSTCQLFQGSSSHQQWLMAKLEADLLDVDVVSQIIESQLKEFAAQILEVDHGLLASAGYRSEYVPSSMVETNQPVLPLVSAAWQIVEKAESMAAYAPIELVGTTILSGVVGSLARQAATDMGSTTNYGSPTQTAQNFGAGVGFAAGLASDFVAKEVIGSARSLKQSAETSLTNGFNSIRLNGSDAYRWTSAINSYIQDEQRKVEGVLIEFIGISHEKASIELR